MFQLMEVEVVIGWVSKSFQKTSPKPFYPFIVNKPSQRNEQLKILVFLEMNVGYCDLALGHAQDYP